MQIYAVVVGVTSVKWCSKFVAIHFCSQGHCLLISAMTLTFGLDIRSSFESVCIVVASFPQIYQKYEAMLIKCDIKLIDIWHMTLLFIFNRPTSAYTV